MSGRPAARVVRSNVRLTAKVSDLETIAHAGVPSVYQPLAALARDRKYHEDRENAQTVKSTSIGSCAIRPVGQFRPHHSSDADLPRLGARVLIPSPAPGWLDWGSGGSAADPGLDAHGRAHHSITSARVQDATL